MESTKPWVFQISLFYLLDLVNSIPIINVRFSCPRCDPNDKMALKLKTSQIDPSKDVNTEILKRIEKLLIKNLMITYNINQNKAVERDAELEKLFEQSVWYVEFTS